MAEWLIRDGKVVGVGDSSWRYNAAISLGGVKGAPMPPLIEFGASSYMHRHALR